MQESVTENKVNKLFSRIVLTLFVVLGGIMLFIGSQLLAAVLAGVGLRVAGYSQEQIIDMFDKNGFLVIVYIASSVLMVAIMYLIVRIAKIDFLNLLGLSKRPGWSDIAWAMLAYSAYFIFVAIASVTVLPLLTNIIDINQQQDFGVDFLKTPENIATLFVMFVILPPIVEEILFRGFMYRSVRKWIPSWVAMVLISVVFGAMHLELLGGNSPNWIAMIDTTLLSLVLVFLVEKTNSLWPAIYVHAIKNFLAFAILVSGIA